jgi:hypothetical protein
MVKLTSPQGVWTGVLVDRGVIATTSHNFPDAEAAQTVATFSDGTRFRCRLIARDDQVDCVLLAASTGTHRCWGLRAANPTAGTRVTIYGFGGSGRAESATVTGSAAPGGTNRWEWFSFSPENAVQSGDSGGPIMDGQGYLAGITSGTGTGVGASVIRGLLARIAGSQGAGGQAGGSVGSGGVTSSPLGQQTPAVPPAASSSVSIDYDKLAAAIVARMAADPEPWRGPPGPAGKDGLNADPAALEEVKRRLAAIEAVYRQPLFYTETYINGQLQSRQEVMRGGTLEYHSRLVEHAPTDSFHINVDAEAVP